MALYSTIKTLATLAGESDSSKGMDIVVKRFDDLLAQELENISEERDSYSEIRESIAGLILQIKENKSNKDELKEIA